MAELPAVTGREAVDAFGKAGFTLARISRSSHHILKKTGHRYLLTIPVHGNKTLKAGLLRSQIRLAGLTIEEFCALL